MTPTCTCAFQGVRNVNISKNAIRRDNAIRRKCDKERDASPSLPQKISKFFDIDLSEISSYSVALKKTDETVQIVCKVICIFDEIFKMYT